MRPVGIGHRRRPQNQGRRRHMDWPIPFHRQRSPGDVDALARRLATITQQADETAQAERAAATNTVPRRPRAKRRWQSKPRTGQLHSGSPPGTGCG